MKENDGWTLAALVGVLVWVAWAGPVIIEGAWARALIGEPLGATRFWQGILPMAFIPVALWARSPKAQTALLQITAGLLLVNAVQVAFSGRDPDELIHLHHAALAAKGFISSRDFFTIWQPMLALMWAPVAGLFWGNLQIVLFSKMFILGVLVLIAVTAGTLAARLGGSAPAAWVLILSNATVVDAGGEFRADPIVALLTLLSLLCMLRGMYVGSGALVGVAVLFSQKAAIFGAGIAFACCCLPGRDRTTRLVRFSAAALAVASLTYVWPLAMGILPEYLFASHIFMKAFANYPARAEPIPGQPPPTSTYLIHAACLQIRQLPVVLPLALLGGLRLAKPPREGQKLLVPVMAAASIAVVVFLKWGYKQYVMLPWVLLGVLAAVGLACLPAREGRLSLRVPVVILLLTASLSMLGRAASAMPVLDLSASQTALDHLGPHGVFYAEDWGQTQPIFCRNASHYITNQAWLEAVFRASDLTPPHYYPLDFPIEGSPPDVLRIQGQERRQKLLQRLAARGYHYRPVEYDLWVRER